MRLDEFTRAVETRLAPEADVAAAIAHERETSASAGGRTGFDDWPRGARPRTPRRGQLSLFEE